MVWSKTPYSLDLREKIVQDSQAGMTDPELAQKYDVSLSTATRYRKRAAHGGD